MWKIIILGLLLRLIIAPITYHPDVKVLSYTSAIFFNEHNLNPYSFVNQLDARDPRKEVFIKELPDDLPLLYFSRTPFDIFLRYLVNEQVEYSFLNDTNSLLGKSELYQYLFFLKFPLIFFDILLGVVLSFVVSPRFRNKALLLWMINPMTLWATAAIGQHDIIPTFFVVLSTFLLQRNRLTSASLSLGLGAAIKSFPFLLAPYLILMGKNWSERIKLSILLVLPYLLSIIPFLSSSEFRQQALFAPQLGKLLYAKIALSGGESIMIVPAILVVLYLLYEQRKKTFANFLAFSTISLMLILAFTHFHIQWFLWITPFLIIYITSGLTLAERLSLAILGGAVVMMLFLFDASLQIRLFSPIFTTLSSAPGLAETLNKTYVDFLKDISATVFSAAAIFFSIRLILSGGDRSPR